MGKIIFEDKTYIEVSRSAYNKFIITITAKDNLSTIAVSAELTLEQFKQLVSLDK
jgi:hypothetical protein